MAKSRATHYNIPENQELNSTALLAGMISDNPLLSYVIIDSKAKSESENQKPVKVTPERLPASGGTVKNLPVETDPKNTTPEPAKGTPTGGNQLPDVVTLETVQGLIAAGNNNLEKDIAATLENFTTSFNKEEVQSLNFRIGKIEESNVTINNSIAILDKKLEELTILNRSPKDSLIALPEPVSKVTTKKQSK